MTPYDEAIGCVQDLNKPCYFSKPASQSDRAAVACALAIHLGSFSATSESSIVSGCSPLRMGADLHERCATSRAYDLTSL